MATFRENIKARMEAIGVELAAMSASTMGGKANVKAQDGGTTIDHVGYRKSLLDELDMLQKQLAKIAETEAALDGTDGGFEIESYMDQ